MQPQPGSQLAGGRYILESRITRSGMGEVWLARQQGGGVSKTVVVKMIHPDLNAHREAQQRFFDEAQIVARIHHPHVVQFYEFGEQENTLFQVMEYIEGYAFSQIIEHASRFGESVPIPVICRLMADACQGLGFIHDMTDDYGNNLELVHRDISPQNLLVSNTGTLKIIDFGIVKAKKKTSRTRTGVIVGKLQYMSPEQLSSEDLDHRSDLYSLGLVLYEMLTLEPRFRGSNLLEIFYEAFNEPPPAIVNLRPDCPPELVACVQKALAQRKEDRFSHAYEMQDVLESYLHRQGTPMTQRHISSFVSNLFAGHENVREETTRIHAASMLSEFQQMQEQEGVDAETLHANIAELDDLGDLDGDPLSGTLISGQRKNSPPSYTGEHTMSAGQPATVETSLPHITSRSAPRHTLQELGGVNPAVESSHWGVPASEQRQRQQNQPPPGPIATLSPPVGPAPQSHYTPPSTGQVSEETVVLSAALLNDVDPAFLSDETVLPTRLQSAARPQGAGAQDRPGAPSAGHGRPQDPSAPLPPTAPFPKTKTNAQARPVTANKATKKSKSTGAKRSSRTPKSTIWLGLSLGLAAFLLGIFLVYFFVGQ